MKLFLITIFISLTVISFSQTSKTISHGGLTREYIEYVPSVYDGSTAVPVLFCLHGLGDNMTNFSGIGMHNVADTANIIVITPQALMASVYGSEVGTAWKCRTGIALAGLHDVEFPIVPETDAIAAIVEFKSLAILLHIKPPIEKPVAYIRVLSILYNEFKSVKIAIRKPTSSMFWFNTIPYALAPEFHAGPTSLP